MNKITPLDTEYSVGSIKTRAAGRSWELRRPADLESLWAAIAEDSHDGSDFVQDFVNDERLPYWVELWPASIALADWLLQNKSGISGKLCLDLGCGLGLSAMAAADLGAKVLAMDYEKDALRFARLNAQCNRVQQPLWTAMDWRAPAVRRGAFDYIWGGDIMYERRFITPVLDFLEYALAPGGIVWLAEPNRNIYDDFRAALYGRSGVSALGVAGRAWSSKRVYTCKVDPLHVQDVKISVSLWELS